MNQARNSRPQLLIDCERLRYSFCGIATVVTTLVKALQRFPDVCQNMSYYGPTNPLRALAPSLPICPWRFWHKIYNNVSGKYDVVHVTHQLSRYFFGNHTSTKILTLHDLNFLHTSASERVKQKRLRTVNRNLRNARYVVCISEFVKNDVLQNTKMLDLRTVKDIVVIHNGIAPPKQSGYDLGRFGFLANKQYILNIGVLMDKKNQKSLIEMLPFIQEDLVLLVSDERSAYAQQTRALIRKLGVSHRVHIVYNASEPEKYALIEHCRALCQPSLAEGFGMPTIEAMAMGKPTILSTRTSLPEIGGQEAAYFLDFSPQHMATVYHKTLEAFGRNPYVFAAKLRARAAQFSDEAMAHKYATIYERALRER